MPLRVPTSGAGLERVRYNVNRVGQAYRTFANWPVVLGEMTVGKLGRGSPELVFRTRDGMEITTPNLPGARLPLFEQFAEDCYDMAAILAPWRGRDVRLFDIGSHVGSFALNVARLAERAHVACFEPSHGSAEFLRRNVAANRLGDRITVHEVALAAREGTAMFDDNDGASVHNGLIQNDARLVHGDDTVGRRHPVEVRTTTFDAAVAEVGPPDIVKLDCEGGEYDLVTASSPDSWNSVSRIVMEYHPVPNRAWSELRDWFAGVGLGVVRERAISPGLGTAWLARG